MIRSRRTCRDKSRVLIVPSALVCMLLPLLGCEKMQERQERKMGFPEANYPRMSFTENGSEVGFVEFDTTSTADLAEVYVEFPDGSRHFLPELTEEVVAKSLEKQGSVNPDNPRTRYCDGLSRIVFRDGKLQSVSLQAGLATWKIAARENGPYLALPISNADLVAQFGEPDSWGVYVPPRAP